MFRLRDNDILLTLIVAAVMWVGVWKHEEVFRWVHHVMTYRNWW